MNYLSPTAFAQVQNPDPMVAAAQQDAMQSRQMGLDALMQQYRSIQDNAQIQAAQQNWQRVMQGGGPMTQRVQGQMLGQAGDMATAAQRAQSEALQRGAAASGGSIYDPSFQAQQQGLDTQRQLQTQGASRDISMQAALANFQAQQQAAGSLATSAMQQQGLASPMASQIANAHLGATFHAPQGMGQGGGGNFTQTLTQPGQYGVDLNGRATMPGRPGVLAPQSGGQLNASRLGQFRPGQSAAGLLRGPNQS